MYKKIIVALTGLAMHVWAEDLASLLQAYRVEADLSKITRSDTAGVVTIFKRDEIEKMQARTLKDLLKRLPVFLYGPTSNNLYLFRRQDASILPSSGVRIFLNDHDLTSSSFGSALLIWGDMPVEILDHVEVYRDACSIEYGSEAGIVIIRLYTKSAQRDEGAKARGYGDTKGGVGSDFYEAMTTGSGDDLFAYLHAATQRYDAMYRANAKAERNGWDGLVYGRYRSDRMTVAMAYYDMSRDSFWGKGRRMMPDGGTLDARHGFATFEYRFSDRLRLHLGYDNIDYKRIYKSVVKDIYVSALTSFVSSYEAKYRDDIATLKIDGRTTVFDSGSLYYGTSLRYKEFEMKGDYDGIPGESDQSLWLISAFSELNLPLGKRVRMSAGVQYDVYDYRGEVSDRQHLIARLGMIYRNDRFEAKGFVTSSYIPSPMYQMVEIHAGGREDSAASPRLKDLTLVIGNLAFRYFYSPQTTWGLQMAQGMGRNHVFYDFSQGAFGNDGAWKKYRYLVAMVDHHFDALNRFHLDWSVGEDMGALKAAPTHVRPGSPAQTAHAYLVNSIGAWDLYNELSWYGKYQAYGAKVGAGIDYTVAIKYHVSPSFSIGLRGENLFERGYRIRYRGIDEAMPVFDRRAIVNLEYLF